MGVSTDPIADLLTSIRNALKARHPKVDVPSSSIKAEIARVLKEEGYIAAYKVIQEKDATAKVLRIYLKYAENNVSPVTGLRRISKPGRRVYRRSRELRPVFGGMGISILTTSHGIMTGKQARRKGISGEILCEVW